MSCCCTGGDPAPRSPLTTPRRSWLRRLAALIQWAIPITTLGLIPKCPLCFAAYVALWTGLGLSFTAAYYLRLALIVLCAAALCFLVASHVRRAILRPRRT